MSGSKRWARYELLTTLLSQRPWAAATQALEVFRVKKDS